MPPLNGVQVTLGGEKRTLRFTTKSLVRLERDTGLAMGEMAGRMAAGSLFSICAFVWAGLIHAEPKLTIDDVVEMANLTDFDALSAATDAALDMAMGKQVEQPEEGKADAGS